MARRTQNDLSSRHQRSRLGWPIVAGWILLLTVVLTIAWIRSVEPLGLDQGLFALVGQLVRDGAVPYRDVWDSKPPLTLYMYPAIFTLLGESATAVWRFEVAWIVISMVAVARLAGRLAGSVAGLVAAAGLFFGLWAPAWSGYLSRAQAEVFLALPLILAATCALSAHESRRSAFWAGVWTGVASLFKVPAVLLWGAWIVAAVLLTRRGAAGAARGSVTRVLLLACGAALPWAVAFAWFGAHGAAGDLFDAVFTYNRAYASVIGAGLSWPGIAGRMLQTLGTAVPALSLLAVIGLAAQCVRRSSTAVWLGLWLALSLAAIVLQQQLAEYHFLIAIPALAVAAGCGASALVDATRAGGARRAVAVIATVVLIGLGGWQAVRIWQALAPDRAFAFGEMDRAAYLRAMRSGAIYPDEEDALARLLRETTPPGSRLLVWGLDPGIYFHAARRPSTRFPFHHLLLCDVPISRKYPDHAARQAQLIEELRRDPPAIVLVASGDAGFFMHEDSRTQLVRFAELNRIVQRDYDPGPRVGSYTVYRRRVAP